jgi:hypothetical protein
MSLEPDNVLCEQRTMSVSQIIYCANNVPCLSLRQTKKLLCEQHTMSLEPDNVLCEQSTTPPSKPEKLLCEKSVTFLTMNLIDAQTITCVKTSATEEKNCQL